MKTVNLFIFLFQWIKKKILNQYTGNKKFGKIFCRKSYFWKPEIPDISRTENFHDRKFRFIFPGNYYFCRKIFWQTIGLYSLWRLKSLAWFWLVLIRIMRDALKVVSAYAFIDSAFLSVNFENSKLLVCVFIL